MSSDRWKAEQRDWLLQQLIELKKRWLYESESKESQFSPDDHLDSMAKARTGGCARQLDELLRELGGESSPNDAYLITACGNCGDEKKFTVSPSDSEHKCPLPLK